jgi:protein-L-isoaspartate(D-aspartate) O-methyltransferase
MAEEDWMNEAEMSVVRRAYAKHVLFIAGVEDKRLEAALATVKREAFLGPGPWPILYHAQGYRLTPNADPVYLYQDVLVGMVAEKGLNNGQPSFVTLLLSLGRPQEGESAVHIGAGLGYYTALLAYMVGKTGRVTAIEYEPDLASRAKANLSGFPQVAVLQGDGSVMPLAPSDVIYVNAGAARPSEYWLDALKDGGRLILPLTTNFRTRAGHSMTQGAVFLIERRGQEYEARWKSGTAIYPCAGM